MGPTLSPLRNGEGDRARSAWWRGRSASNPVDPSTMLRMVPLPVPGKN